MASCINALCMSELVSPVSFWAKCNSQDASASLKNIFWRKNVSFINNNIIMRDMLLARKHSASRGETALTLNPWHSRPFVVSALSLSHSLTLSPSLSSLAISFSHYFYRTTFSTFHQSTLYLPSLYLSPFLYFFIFIYRLSILLSFPLSFYL